MEVQEIWRIVGERWRVIVSAVLLAVSLALAWTLAGPVQYRAQARIMISTFGSLGTAMDAYNGERIAQLRAPTYAQLLRGPEIAARAATALGPRFTPELIETSLDARISAAVPMVVLTAKAKTPDDAARIVTMVAQVFADYVKEIEQPGRDGSLTAVRLTSDPPEVSRANNPITAAALAALAGLAVGIVIALYRDRMDQVLRNPGQLARVGMRYRGVVAFNGADGRDAQESFRKLAVECITNEDLGGARLMVSGVDASAPTLAVVRGLAGGFASYGRATVLVNAMHSEGQDDQGSGLSDFLAGTSSWQACLHSTEVRNAESVSVGSDGARLDELLIRASHSGLELPIGGDDGQLVVAAPPILTSPVSAALSGFVDACLLVVTLRSTLLSDLVEASMTLDALECRLAGVVVVTEESLRALQRATAESVPANPVRAPVAAADQ